MASKDIVKTSSLEEKEALLAQGYVLQATIQSGPLRNPPDVWVLVKAVSDTPPPSPALKGRKKKGRAGKSGASDGTSRLEENPTPAEKDGEQEEVDSAKA